MLSPGITKIAFVALANLLLGASRRGHDARSIIKKCHVGVPDREHQEQKRKWYMDEKPAVEPVLQTHLQIEHTALIAPPLNFFDTIAVGFRHTQFSEPKRVVRETDIAEAELFAASCLEIGKNLAIE